MSKKNSWVHVLVDDGPDGCKLRVYTNEHDVQSAYIGLVFEDENVTPEQKAAIRSAKAHADRYRLADDAYHECHDEGDLDYSYYIEYVEVQ